MIRSFADKDTESVWQRKPVRQFRAFERAALRKLVQINAGLTLEDLRFPPGNRLEALKGARRGQMSLRINDQWRICFRWKNGGAEDVEIVDITDPSRVFILSSMKDRHMALITPIHPGEVLAEDFMKPLELSANALAKRLGVPANRISSIVGGKRDILPDTALRLERAFGSSAEFWLNLQAHYDLEITRDQLDKKTLSSIKLIEAA